MKYMKYILSDMPGTAFLEYPEYLEDYLPWNPYVKEICTYALTLEYKGLMLIFIYTILFYGTSTFYI